MRITVITTDAEYQELKLRAGPVPLSRWLKLLGLGGELPLTLENVMKVAEAVPVSELPKISEPAVDSKRSLPRARPVRRKHLPESADTQETGSKKKKQCSYGWPANSTKCPNCHEVHTYV